MTAEFALTVLMQFLFATLGGFALGCLWRYRIHPALRSIRSHDRSH